MRTPGPDEEGISESVRAVLDERARQLDEHREATLAKQRARGALTARERIDLLIDAGTFLEYGVLAQPAHPDLTGAADGVVTGFGEVDGRPTGLISFDYSVFGGTQGPVTHAKIDSILERAYAERFPLVIFNEGGGTRVQEMQTLHRGTTTFPALSRLAGVVPVVCAVMGRAFAGNANIAGLANFLLATRDSALGLAGPPVVEAALGHKLTPEEIGSIEDHCKCGNVDVVVEDDKDGIETIRQILGYFGGPTATYEEPGPPEALRTLVPENPRRAYDVRKVIGALVDAGSGLELRAKFAPAVVTSLATIGGWPVAIVANQPMVKAGAIDGDGADKLAYFIRLADIFDLPIVFLVDTPGFMVGPDAERTALVRRGARVVHAMTHATVPILTVQTRKAYGFAAFALGGTGFKPVISLVWPTAEYGAMGLEGASRVVNRGETSREEHQERAEGMRSDHDAWQRARTFFADDLIDPAETRDRLVRALHLVMPGRKPVERKPTPDAW